MKNARIEMRNARIEMKNACIKMKNARIDNHLVFAQTSSTKNSINIDVKTFVSKFKKSKRDLAYKSFQKFKINMKMIEKNFIKKSNQLLIFFILFSMFVLSKKNSFRSKY